MMDESVQGNISAYYGIMGLFLWEIRPKLMNSGPDNGITSNKHNL